MRVLVFFYLSFISFPVTASSLHLSFDCSDENTLSKMTASQLRLARNEVFARHGKTFRSAELRAYFLKQKWYHPQEEDLDISLSDEEKSCVKRIQRHEKKDENRPKRKSLEQHNSETEARLKEVKEVKPHIDKAIREWEEANEAQLSFLQNTKIQVESVGGSGALDISDQFIVKAMRSDDVISTTTVNSMPWEACVGLSCVPLVLLCSPLMLPLLSFGYVLGTPDDVMERTWLPIVDGGGQNRVRNMGEAFTGCMWMQFAICLIPVAPLCGAAGLKILGPTVVAPYLMSTAALRSWRREAAFQQAVDTVLTDASRKHLPRSAMAF